MLKKSLLLIGMMLELNACTLNQVYLVSDKSQIQDSYYNSNYYMMYPRFYYVSPTVIVPNYYNRNILHHHNHINNTRNPNCDRRRNVPVVSPRSRIRHR